jgi:hypothetical protein
MADNIAAWLPGVKNKIEVGPADTPEPSPGELLIEVSKDTAYKVTA